MKIAIFGATGRTGQHLVRQALDRGYEVVAFVRTPSKLKVPHKRLSIVQGDVTDRASVVNAVAGVDAVLSTLGPARGESFTVIGQGVSNILQAMMSQQVKRLLVVVGAGVGDPQDQPRLFDKLINGVLKLLSRQLYEEMKSAANMIRNADLDWTLVRVPMLTDNAETTETQVGYLGGDVGSRLSRENLARFMLNELDEGAYIQQAPVISS